MTVLRFAVRLVRRIVAGAVPVIALSSFSSIPLTAQASASRLVPTCYHNQLEVAVAWDLPPAAGSNGIPFVIANTSKSTCSIEGFPRLSIDPGTYKKRTVKVIPGGGNIFVPVKPRLVVIKPGADASFGLDFGDASNQQDPTGAACTTQNIYVTLPVRVNQFPQNYETTVNFNFCAADFVVEVTPFESGPLPREG